MLGHVRAKIAGLVLVAALVVTGCSGDDPEPDGSTKRDDVVDTDTDADGTSSPNPRDLPDANEAPELSVTATEVLNMTCDEMGRLSNAEVGLLDSTSGWDSPTSDALAVSDFPTWSAAARAGCLASPPSGVEDAIELALDPFAFRSETLDSATYSRQVHNTFTNGRVTDTGGGVRLPNFSSQVSFFQPGKGEVHADPDVIFAGYDTFEPTFFAPTSIEKTPYVAVAIDVVPGEGLDPGFHRVIVSSYDALSMTWRTKEVSGEGSQASVLEIHDVNALFGPTVLVRLSSPDETYTLSVNIADLTHAGKDSRFITSAVNSFLVTETVDDGDCQTLTGRTGLDESALWTVNSRDFPGTVARPTCTRLSFSDEGNGLAEVRITGNNYNNAYFDTWTGEKLNPAVGGTSLYDPIQQLAYYHPTGWGNEDPHTVVDAKSGEAVWSMTQEEVSRLGLTARGLWDGILYVETINGNVALDIATGDDSETWTRYPVNLIGDWTHYSDDRLEREPLQS